MQEPVWSDTKQQQQQQSAEVDPADSAATTINKQYKLHEV
jgi:hypothetical protein